MGGGFYFEGSRTPLNEVGRFFRSFFFSIIILLITTLLFVFKMANEFFDIIDILERVKRKNPKKSFTELLYMTGVNDLDYSGSILNNWTSSLKMKDNRTDTDKEVLDRVTNFWLSNGGEKSSTLLKQTKDE